MVLVRISGSGAATVGARYIRRRTKDPNSYERVNPQKNLKMYLDDLEEDEYEIAIKVGRRTPQLVISAATSKPRFELVNGISPL